MNNYLNKDIDKSVKRRFSSIQRQFGGGVRKKQAANLQVNRNMPFKNPKHDEQTTEDDTEAVTNHNQLATGTCEEFLLNLDDEPTKNQEQLRKASLTTQDVADESMTYRVGNPTQHSPAHRSVENVAASNNPTHPRQSSLQQKVLRSSIHNQNYTGENALSASKATPIARGSHSLATPSLRVPKRPPDVSDITEVDEESPFYGARKNHVVQMESETSSFTSSRQLSPLQQEVLRHQSVPRSRQLSAISKKISQPKYSRIDESGGYDDVVPPKSRRSGSIMLPALDDDEKLFHELVGAGDVSAVLRFLTDHREVDINCVSYQKMSALHVALKNKNVEMVEFLLDQRSLNVCDAVLTAVKVGDGAILERVLARLDDTHPGLEFKTCPDSAEFGDDITPLMLAACEGKFEIVDLLLKRGHRMPAQHHPYCSCKKCMERLRKYDRLKYASMKINLYKALANPTYLFHTCADPIRRAFELTGELQDAAQMFPTFKDQYAELWTQLREFSHDFIACCRNAEEVEIILKQPAGCEAGGLLMFPRLQLAIDLNQKEFVAHPYTQAAVQSAWLGDEMSWKQQPAWQQALAPIIRIPMLFVLFLTSLCGLGNVFVRSYSNPVNKFISSQASYLVFLCLLFTFSIMDKTRQKHGPPTSYIIYPIIVYVIGFIWNTLRLCFTLGPKRFFSYGWSLYDLTMELLFMMTFFFWLASWADLSARGNNNSPRKFWYAYDPILLAEGFFAIATILAFLKLYLPLSLNYHLGPLQISIGKMTKDLYQFVFIFVIMVLAFTVGVCHFYQPYDGMVQTNHLSNSTTTQISSFVSLTYSLKTFFWAIFGQSPIESADVVIENLDDGTINTHNFTEGVGYFVFAMYNFLATVVVLNMLVACMANTFTKVIDNVSVEWIFGRTKIYLLYMYHGVLPPPFNLIPTITDLCGALTWLTSLGRDKSDKARARFSLTHCCYMERAPDPKLEDLFISLMSELTQRYLVMKEENGRDGSTESSNNAELDEIKAMLQAFISRNSV